MYSSIPPPLPHILTILGMLPSGAGRPKVLGGPFRPAIAIRTLWGAFLRVWYHLHGLLLLACWEAAWLRSWGANDILGQYSLDSVLGSQKLSSDSLSLSWPARWRPSSVPGGRNEFSDSGNQDLKYPHFPLVSWMAAWVH